MKPLSRATAEAPVNDITGRASRAEIQIGPYAAAVREEARELGISAWDRVMSAKEREHDPKDLARRAEAVLGKIPEIKGLAQGDDRAIDAVLLKLIRLPYAEETWDASYKLKQEIMAYQESLGEVPDPDRYTKDAEEVIAATEKNLTKVVQAVQSAAGRVPHWGGHRLIVRANAPYNRDNMFSPAKSFYVMLVNDRGPGFSVFTSSSGSVESVDDILEGGDRDFFRDAKVQADYFDLVRELEKPGSSKRGRDIVLYTARPTKDRTLYERARKVPVNIFLTTDARRAVGIAHDLGSGEVRDVWRVVINTTNLIPTLTVGRHRDYQTVGAGSVPVRSMELWIEGQSRTATCRTLAEAYVFGWKDAKAYSTVVRIGDRAFRPLRDETPNRTWELQDTRTGERYYAYFYRLPGQGLTEFHNASWVSLESQSDWETVRYPIASFSYETPRGGWSKDRGTWFKTAKGKRYKTPESQQYHADQKDQARHVVEAQKAFKRLVQVLVPHAEQAREAFPGNDKQSQSRRARAFVSAVNGLPEVLRYLDEFIGTDKDDPKAKSWRQKVIYVARDILVRGLALRDGVEQVGKEAFKGFQALTMSEAQAPLRAVVPEQIMAFLPKNIVVTVDDKGFIQQVTDRFENEHETLGVKVATMRRLIGQYNDVVKTVKADLRSNDEITQMAALITAIIMETGIRPGKAGNQTVKVVNGEDVVIETFGALTLGPRHVKFVRENFAELEFVGKKGGLNLAHVGDRDIVTALQTYVEKALQTGTPHIFVTSAGKRFTYNDLQKYFQAKFPAFSPTDFRKLRATSAVLFSLHQEQQNLYQRLREFSLTETANLKERVVEEIARTFEAAIESARATLSHESVMTTVRAYINPEVILRFLNEASVDATLESTILSGQSRLGFNPKQFVGLAHHLAKQESKAASSLGDLIQQVEDLMGEEGVRHASLATLMQRVEDLMDEEGVPVPKVSSRVVEAGLLSKLRDGWVKFHRAMGQEWRETKELGRTISKLLRREELEPGEARATKEQIKDIFKILVTQGTPIPGASIAFEVVAQSLGKLLGRNWTTLPSAFRAARIAKTFSIDVGTPVWFGKYKNKRGIVKEFKENDKGDIIVTIEPVPKGRKQPKEMKLFKIRPRVEKEGSDDWELGDEVMPRVAGVFEAPPAMVETIGTWMKAVYAGHILAGVEVDIERTRDALAPVRRAAEEMEAALNSLSAVPGLNIGQSIKFKVYSMAWGYEVEVKSNVAGIMRVDPTKVKMPRWGWGRDGGPPDPSRPWYVIGFGEKSISWKPQRSPFLFHHNSEEATLKNVRTHLSREIRKIKAVLDDPDKLTPPDMPLLVELELLKRECLKFTDKAKSYKGMAKAKFDVDLTGWKYITDPAAAAQKLKDAGWSKINVELDFKGTQYKGGHWSPKDHQLNVELGLGTTSRYVQTAEQARTVADFHYGMAEMLRTLRHEGQHVGQDLLRDIKGLGEDAGLPSKTIRNPEYDSRGVSKKKDEEGKLHRKVHPLLDTEFYTRLADEIDKFARFSRKIPLDQRREALRVWVGDSPKDKLLDANGDVIGAVQQFFFSLKKYEKGKWKKAVAEFYKGVKGRVKMGMGSVTARRIPIDETSVTAWRKEFLLLMSNLKRVSNLTDAEKWRKGARRWADNLEKLMAQIREEIAGRLREDRIRDSWKRKVNEGWAKHYRDSQKPVWEMIYEVRNGPQIPDEEAKVKRLMGWPSILLERDARQKVLDDWKEEARLWEQRAKSKARDAWKFLKEMGEWAMRGGSYGGGEEPVMVTQPETVNREIAGFKVQMYGFEGDEFQLKGLSQLEDGLRFYAQRAKAAFPWLLQHQLPMRAFFVSGGATGGRDRSASASYEHDHIALYVWALHSDRGRFAHIVAHEMGHHIFKTVLSPQARSDWSDLIRGDYKQLDLRDVLARMKPGENTFRFDERIQDEDPILHLQLQTLLNDHRYTHLNLIGAQSIREYLDRGGDPVVMVPAKPITGYGGKNPEEAFCEVLGRLVGYGPRTVLPEIKAWMRRFVPNVRIAAGYGPAELPMKGSRHVFFVYGDDGGSWYLSGQADLRFQRTGWTWQMATGYVGRGVLSVDGATERHRGFRKALNEVVAKWPELRDWQIMFDGPKMPVSRLVGGSGEIQKGRDWSQVMFYHGTSQAAWEVIQTQGLRPRSETGVEPVYGVGVGAGASRLPGVYLTTQLGMAHFAAREAGNKSGTFGVVLEITGIDGKRLLPDEDSGEETAEGSLGRIGSAAYVGTIPPSQIKLHSYRDLEQRRWVTARTVTDNATALVEPPVVAVDKKDGTHYDKLEKIEKAAERRKLAWSRQAKSLHDRSIALMKFLSDVSRRLGVGKHVYVVGGAVRNFVIDKPIKDIDVVIDSVALGRDSEWFAKEIAKAIPAQTSLVTNQYGVAILTVKGSWVLDGEDLNGEVIEIANARKESYGGTGGKGYKPSEVEPATIEEDMCRREFTFNCLLWRLHDLANGPDKAEILDLTGCGLADLQAGRMKCPSDPDKTFSDDPTRMLRAIKFFMKYGLALTPDTAASIQRNAPKLKQAPHEAISSLLIGTILKDSGTASKALAEMKRLGLLDVIADILRDNRQFRATMQNWASSKKVSMLFNMMDVGLPLNARINFLTPDQQKRLREVSLALDPGEPERLVDALKQPGRVMETQAVVEATGLQGREIARITEKARELLLMDPTLMRDSRKLEALVIRSLGGRSASVEVPTWQLDAVSEVVATFREASSFRNRTAGLRDFTPEVVEAFLTSFVLPFQGRTAANKEALLKGLLSAGKKLWTAFKKAPKLWDKFKQMVGIKGLTDIPRALKDLAKRGLDTLKRVVGKLFETWPLKLYTIEKGKLFGVNDIIEKLMKRFPRFKQWLESKAKPAADQFDKWLRKYLPGIAHAAMLAIYVWIWLNVTEFSWDIKSLTDVIMGSMTLGDLLGSLPESGLGFLMNGLGYGTFTLLPAAIAMRIAFLIGHRLIEWNGSRFTVNEEKIEEAA